MFGWRKRNDGFEWREYVRTTILVRRKDRRQRLGQAAKAAAEGLKAAGHRGAAAGAVGAQAIGEGAKAAGKQGAAMSAAGLHAAGSKLRVGIPVAWMAAKALASGIAKVLLLLWIGLQKGISRAGQMLAPVLVAGWQRLGPAFVVLRQPNISVPLAIAGGVALLAGVGRAVTSGLDGDTAIALLVGLFIVGVLLAARFAHGAPPWLAAPLRMASEARGRLRFGSTAATVLRGAAAAAVLVVVVCGGVLAWRSAPAWSDFPSLAASASTVEGRAIALSGDTLRIKKSTVRISGIEAPIRGQTCLSARSRRWRCDVAAKTALTRLVRRKRVTCELSGTDDGGRTLGSCRAEGKDIAAELVRAGRVFARTGFFAPYGSLEKKAHAAKIGLWRGEAARPSDYRAQKWEEAKRDAPDGCPIKGDVKRGRRIYVLPWSRGYERVRVRRSRGERWFCSEAEARAAGWKPSGRS